MKKFVIALMAIMLVSGLATAGKDHGPSVIVPQQAEGESRATGDDCSDPILIGTVDIPYLDAGNTTCGRGNVYSDTDMGNYDGGEEIIYMLTLDADLDIDVSLISDTPYTGIAIFDGCPDSGILIAGIGSYLFDETLSGLSLSAGTYYIMIDTWPLPDCINSFDLAITEAAPPCETPANDTCAGALPLVMCETTIIDDMCGATNAYSPGAGGCTGYSANGLDLVYSVELIADQQLTVTGVTSFDNSIYLVSDCADPVGSCVAGADATTNGTETLVFDAGNAPGTYYLILDGYSVNEAGWEVTVDCVISTEATTFDSIKSMYR